MSGTVDSEPSNEPSQRWCLPGRDVPMINTFDSILMRLRCGEISIQNSIEQKAIHNKRMCRFALSLSLSLSFSAAQRVVCS